MQRFLTGLQIRIFCVLYPTVIIYNAKSHFGVVTSVRLRCSVPGIRPEPAVETGSWVRSKIDVFEEVFFQKQQKHWFFLRTRSQHFMSMQIQIRDFDNQKCNLLQVIKAFFLWKIAINFSLGLHKGRPGYMRSLQNLKKEHEHWTLQKMKIS